MKKALIIICVALVVSLLWWADIIPAPQLFQQLTVEPEARYLSLDDCVKYTIHNSFEIRMARLDLYIAQTDLTYEQAVYDTILYGGIGYEEDKRQQISVFSPNDNQINTYSIGLSKTLPTGTELSAEFTDIRQWNNSAFVTLNPSHTSELSLTATQPIWKNAFGNNDRRRISLTKLAIKNVGLEKRDQLEALIAKVTKAYWDMVYAKKSLEIFTDMLKRAKKLHATNERNFKIGLIEKVDLYASESNVSLMETDVLLAENSYNRAEKNLKLIMNLDDDEPIMVRSDLSEPDLDKDLSTCLQESFKNRRDYKIVKRDAKIKGLDLKIKENQQLPELDLTLSMASNGIDPKYSKATNTAFAVNHPDYYAGFEFSMAIENSQARSQYNKAKFEKEKALIGIKEIEREIITDVGNAFRDAQSYEASLVYIKRAAELQAKKLKEEEKRFNYGRSNTKRLIDYQQDLLRAEMEDAVFSLKYLKSRVDLDRAMNTILPRYEELL
jgi:outer membrane protein TolC